MKRTLSPKITIYKQQQASLKRLNKRLFYYANIDVYDVSMMIKIKLCLTLARLRSNSISCSFIIYLYDWMNIISA